MISDPVVRDMNDSRWIFEWEGLLLTEEEKREEFIDLFELFKKSIINILGLDITPVLDEETGMLRRPNKDEFLPLSVLCGRKEIVNEMSTKISDMIEQEENPPSNTIGSLEELEELERSQLDDGDIEFSDDPEALRKFLAWNSQEAKYIRKHVIETIPDEPDNTDQVVEQSNDELKDGVIID